MTDEEPRGTALTPAAYGASRAVLWTGVSALFTDAGGRGPARTRRLPPALPPPRRRGGSG
ncbi:hypothetical protein [Streptomyces sp. SolWspMP-sol7th]|uniref:hypothetical protein n=1 Tax=Streptomyces sp. SolWspMP-sol7th TaxID=1839776 RepID=UPI000A732FC0|nr:hypothetical protein [Streptomyces sp. SolWspMP-sol7th]